MPYKDKNCKRNYNRDHPVDNKKYRSKHVSSGLCRCGRPRSDGYTKCQSCLSQSREDSKKRNAKRRESGACSQCGKPLDGASKSRCAKCLSSASRYLRRLKAKVIAAYGGKCECCGESEPAFLTIDHVNNNGSEHRKSIGSNRIYGWLEKHGFPRDGFQLLCFNCNCGRRINGGICPHQSAIPGCG